MSRTHSTPERDSRSTPDGKAGDQAARQRLANEILARVERESTAIGHSHVSRLAEPVGRHFRATDAAPNDPIELWGRRIGRALSLVAVIVLVIVLARTYLQGLL